MLQTEKVKIIYGETRNVNIGDYESVNSFLSIGTTSALKDVNNNVILSLHERDSVEIDAQELEKTKKKEARKISWLQHHFLFLFAKKRQYLVFGRKRGESG